MREAGARAMTEVRLAVSHVGDKGRGGRSEGHDTEK